MHMIDYLNTSDLRLEAFTPLAAPAAASIAPLQRHPSASSSRQGPRMPGGAWHGFLAWPKII